MISKVTGYNTTEYGNRASKNNKMSFSAKNPESLLTKGFKKVEASDTCRYLVLSMGSMTIPRTIIDTVRNKYAGAETLFYELYSSAVNYVIPGFVALGIAKGLQFAHNKGASPDKKLDFNVWANNKTLDKMGNIWKSTKADSKQARVEGFVKSVLSKSEVLNGDKWTNIGNALEQDKSLNNYVKSISKTITRAENGSINKSAAKRISVITEKMAASLGASDSVKFDGVSSSLNNLNKNMFDLTNKVFLKTKNKNIENVLSKYKKVNNVKTAGALGLIATATFGAQFINRYITYKRTGKKEFVGYTDFNKADSPQPKNKTKAKKPSFSGNGAGNFLSGFVFDKYYPNAHQVKFLIGPSSASGAVLASRDKNEKRERMLKASFALTNMFFLPDVIEKMVIWNSKFKDQLLKYPGKEKSFSKSKIKSYNDIAAACKKQAAEQIKAAGKTLPTKAEVNKIIMQPDSTLKQLQKVKNTSKIAGIAWTLTTIGAGIPIINTIITNKKHQEDLEKAKSKNTEQRELIPEIKNNEELKTTFKEFIK